MCNQYGPTLEPALVPLARALALFDRQLVTRVQKFHDKRASPTDEIRESKTLRLLADCGVVRQQWEDIDSGQCQFSELYLTSNSLVPIWTEGMRIIKGVLRSKQTSNNQSKVRDDYVRILTDYESLADDLQTQMVDAAHQGLFEPEFFHPIQERWMRLDETVKLYCDSCNHNAHDDGFHVFRRSLTW